jgi:prefoldin alpha subunit
MKMDGTDKKQELQNMFAEADAYQKQLDSLKNEARMLEATMEETRATISALDALKENKPGASILMPIGSGCVIRAKLEDTDNVIVGVGAGISIENKLADAKKYLEERVEQINKAMEKLQKSAYAINQKLLEIEEESKELIADVRTQDRQKTK